MNKKPNNKKEQKQVVKIYIYIQQVPNYNYTPTFTRPSVTGPLEYSIMSDTLREC